MDLDSVLIHLVADTPTSKVWKIRQSDGSLAVLKRLHPGETEGLRGFTYLQDLAGRGRSRSSVAPAPHS